MSAITTYFFQLKLHSFSLTKGRYYYNQNCNFAVLFMGCHIFYNYYLSAKAKIACSLVALIMGQLSNLKIVFYYSSRS